MAKYSRLVLVGVMGVMGFSGMILSKSTKKELVPISIKIRPFHGKVKEGVGFCEALNSEDIMRFELMIPYSLALLPLYSRGGLVPFWHCPKK